MVNLQKKTKIEHLNTISNKKKNVQKTSEICLTKKEIQEKDSPLEMVDDAIDLIPIPSSHTPPSTHIGDHALLATSIDTSDALDVSVGILDTVGDVISSVADVVGDGLGDIISGLFD